MSRPLIPGISDPVFRMTQSRRQATMSLVCHRGVQRIVSRYKPPAPGLLGAQKVAIAEWNTAILVILFVEGHRERGGIPVDVGFRS